MISRATLLWSCLIWVDATSANELNLPPATLSGDRPSELLEQLRGGYLDSARIHALSPTSLGEFMAFCGMLDDVNCLDKLLSAGVSPNLREARGLTPLIVTIGANATQAAKRLVEAGADTAKETSRGSAAAYAISAGSPEMIRIVLGNTPAAGNALMQRASATGDPTVLRTAVALGADPDAIGPSGATPSCWPSPAERTS